MMETKTAQQWTSKAPVIREQLIHLATNRENLAIAFELRQSQGQELAERLTSGEIAVTDELAVNRGAVDALRDSLTEAQRRETLKQAELDGAIVEDEIEAKFDVLAEVGAKALGDKQARHDFFATAATSGLLCGFTSEVTNTGTRRKYHISTGDLITVTSAENLGTQELAVRTNSNSRRPIFAEIEERRSTFIARLKQRGVDVTPLFKRQYGDDWTAL